MEVQFQLFDVHGEKITVRAMFELLPVRRPILSVSRLVDKGFAVVLGNDLENKMSKNGRVIDLHTNPLMLRECHTGLSIYHSELGVHNA